MIKNIHDIIDKRFDEEISELQKILKKRSLYEDKEKNDIYPFGKQLAECLEVFLSLASKKNFDTKNIDNMVGFAEIGKGDKLIGILAHLDTVPEGDASKWTFPPFAAEIHDNKIYARGTIDDKGPLVAAFYALNALNESGLDLKKRFRLIIGLDEETGFRCVKRYLKTEETPYFSFSPDADFPLVNGEKGLLQFAIKRKFPSSIPEPVKLLGITAGERPNVVPSSAKAYFYGNTQEIKRLVEDMKAPDISCHYVDDYLEVEAKGMSTHAMHPHKGKNALLKLSKVISELDFGPRELLYWFKDLTRLFESGSNGESLGIACCDDISGALTINAAVIRYSNSELIMQFDIRYPITLAPDEAEAKAKSVSKKLGSLFQILTHMEPLYMPADSAEIKALLKSYETVTSEEAIPRTLGGATYCRAFPNAVSFGPHFLKDKVLAHENDEYISLESLRKMTHIFAESLYRLNEL